MPYADIDRQREFQRNWKRAKKEWFWERKKGLSCERCGFSHPAAIQFHHRVGEVKLGEVGRMVQTQTPIEKIEAEIAKCEVLCANCHSIEHFNAGYSGGRPQSAVA